MTMREKMALSLYGRHKASILNGYDIAQRINNRPWDKEELRLIEKDRASTLADVHILVRDRIYGDVDACLDAMAQPSNEMYESAWGFLAEGSDGAAYWRQMIRAAREGK